MSPMPNDRAMLAMLRARYDHGQVSPGVYAVIKKIECDISWNQHADEIGSLRPSGANHNWRN
jgi:hypothetical protein